MKTNYQSDLDTTKKENDISQVAFHSPLARRLGKFFLPSISVGEPMNSPPLRFPLR
uniref:Uncharacterized protein n=1 Tax=Aegilops tauschii subsp. strangulata TaxID=200361 RepID=A0A453S0L9_AEGTS